MKNKKGITLIALVITIIILLLLAGISINMISGQDGILNKATKARNENQQAQTEDQLKLLSSEYQLEKYSSGKSLEDYLKEKLNGATVIKSRYEDSAQVEHNGKKYVVLDTGEVTEINEENNLVKNGFLTYKDNTNFLDWTYDDMGFLTKTVAEESQLIFSTNFIEIDSSKKYFQSITMKSSDENAVYYIGFSGYDVDGKNIHSMYSAYVDGSLTYLEKDINNGDTVIYLNDVSGFKEPTTINLAETQNGFIFWNYKDSTGYQYPEETYSRIVYYALFDYDQIDTENNTITLRNAWDKGTIVAGTKLSQSSSGSTYNWGILNGTLSNNWTTKCNVISGIIDNGNVSSFKSFRPGTKYIKIAFLLNYKDLPYGETINIKDIIFQEIK